MPEAFGEGLGRALGGGVDAAAATQPPRTRTRAQPRGSADTAVQMLLLVLVLAVASRCGRSHRGHSHGVGGGRGGTLQGAARRSTPTGKVRPGWVAPGRAERTLPHLLQRRLVSFCAWQPGSDGVYTWCPYVCGMSMFDWPEKRSTSPTTTSASRCNTAPARASLSTSVCEVADAGRAGSVADHAAVPPGVALARRTAVAQSGVAPARVRQTRSPAGLTACVPVAAGVAACPKPWITSGLPRCSTMCDWKTLLNRAAALPGGLST